MRVLNIHGVGDVRLDNYERPAAGPRDVVVRMKACGICGSDLSYIKVGGMPAVPGGTTALGHEGAGEVIEVGSEVAGVKVGERIVFNGMETPGNIGSGGPEGAFTEELLVRDAELGKSILPIPAGIPYDVAALCEPLAVAMHGVNRAEVKPGDKVVVFGCGPIGLGMILWLVDRGIDVVALDLAPERRERALALGARAALDPTKVDLREELMKLHGEARSFNRHGPATDAYIDAAGAPNIVADVVTMAKYHSRLVITAAYMKPIEVPVGRMLTSEMTITTAMGYPTEMSEVLAAMPRLKDKIASIISHKLPFDQVMDGLEIAATPQSAKVMIEFEATQA